MTAQLTETSGHEENNGRSRAYQSTSTVKKPIQNGSLAMLLGGVSLLGALAGTQTSRVRQSAKGLAGGALFVIGIKQLRAEQTGESDETGTETKQTGNNETKVSDEAHAEIQQDLGAQRTADESQSVYQSETDPNPRGMTDRSDVKGEQDREGDIHFVEGEQPETHRETHLEDEDAHDTRLHPECDDESTEVDISEAAMADEINEAAGPHPEQAYPAREGTDPEPTSEKAPERIGEGAVAPTGPDTEDNQTNNDPDEDGDQEETTK